MACFCLQTGSPLEDIVWFGPGGSADTAWKVTSDTMGHTSIPTSIDGGSIAAEGSFSAGTLRELLLVRPPAE